ncbi:MAG TPA: 16S rRNA (uracil(1498)-N(3))-methyltransferase, partial [Pseudomonadales bacterium]
RPRTRVDSRPQAAPTERDARTTPAVIHRLYVPPSLESGQTLKLTGDRAHYLTRVLRLRRGEAVECFDGSGRAWRATLVDASVRHALLAVQETVADEPAPAPRLHLVQGLLKGASMDVVVQKATELGATDLHPVLAERSNVPQDPARRERKLEHWQRVIESAAEQSRTLHLPALYPVERLTDWLAAPPPARLVMLHPGAPALPVGLPREDLAVLIGPEGGWSDAERAAALDAGAVCYGLGRRILRGETAPLAVLAAVRHGWGWD